MLKKALSEILRLVILYGETYFLAPFAWNELTRRPIVAQSKVHWLIWCTLMTLYVFHNIFATVKAFGSISDTGKQAESTNLFLVGNILLFHWSMLAFALLNGWKRREIVAAMEQYVKHTEKFEAKFGSLWIEKDGKRSEKMLLVVFAGVGISLVMIVFFTAILYPGCPGFISSYFSDEIRTSLPGRVGFAVVTGIEAVMVWINSTIWTAGLLPWLYCIHKFLEKLEVKQAEQPMDFDEFMLAYRSLEVSAAVLNDLGYHIIPAAKLFMIVQSACGIFLAVRCPQALMRVFFALMALNTCSGLNVGLKCISSMATKSEEVLEKRRRFEGRNRKRELFSMRGITAKVAFLYKIDTNCAPDAMQKILEHSVNLLLTY